MPLFNGSIHRNPRRYSNPHELAKAIDEYVQKIEDGFRIHKKKNGEEIYIFGLKPSIAGLCIHLGMSSKASLFRLALSGNKSIKEIIETSMLWIEAFYVENMQSEGSNVTAYQFLLTNMGYKKSDHDVPMLPSAENVGNSKMSSVNGDTKKVAPNVIRINLVESKDSLPDEVVRNQLKIMGGDDSEVLNAIDEEYALRNGTMKIAESDDENTITQVPE